MPIQLRRVHWILGVLLVAAWPLICVTSAWLGQMQEPLYGGKRLSQLLYHDDFEFVWMPNDVYGHIHDEFWEEICRGPAAFPAGLDETNSRWVQVANPQPHLDTNAIPFLVEWMRSRATPWDELRDRATSHLPLGLAARLNPYLVGGWSSRAGRWHIAACEGFGALGTNAEPALPALSNQLYDAEADLPLTLAIARIGPQGMALLTNAIAGTNSELRDSAALALGMEYYKARMALPALVDCVEAGHASYHILGAIGRIRGHDPRLVPALVRLLEASPPARGTQLDDGMAILVLGLHGAESRAAIPILLARYRSEPPGPPSKQRLFLRRVIRAISPESESELPPPPKEEMGEDWP